jgi:hypothetical protein
MIQKKVKTIVFPIFCREASVLYYCEKLSYYPISFEIGMTHSVTITIVIVGRRFGISESPTLCEFS